MQKIPDSVPLSPTDAFLECVARCLAERWLERERGALKGELLSKGSASPISEGPSTKAKKSRLVTRRSGQ